MAMSDAQRQAWENDEQLADDQRRWDAGERGPLARDCPQRGARANSPCHRPDGPPRADGTGLTYHGQLLARPHAARSDSPDRRHV
jgi:hypothetical protein